jgi:hypothetical protein
MVGRCSIERAKLAMRSVVERSGGGEGAAKRNVMIEE